MKKVIIALAFILGSSAVYSQDPTPKMFHFGLKVAPTLAWMKTNVKELKNDGMKLGFAYGLMTEFGFTRNYAFATGVDITYRGGKVKYQSLDTPVYIAENAYNLQYIEVPLTLKMKTNMIGPMTYFGQIGIAPGFAIRTKGNVKADFMTALDTISAQIDDDDVDINKLNMSMIISLGAEYNLGGSTNLLMAITFNNGFTNVLKDADEIKDSAGKATKFSDISSKGSYDLKAVSNYLALTVGILF